MHVALDKSAMTNGAWPRPLPGALLIPQALLVVADFQGGICRE